MEKKNNVNAHCVGQSPFLGASGTALPRGVEKSLMFRLASAPRSGQRVPYAVGSECPTQWAAVGIERIRESKSEKLITFVDTCAADKEPMEYDLSDADVTVARPLVEFLAGDLPLDEHVPTTADELKDSLSMTDLVPKLAAWWNHLVHVQFQGKWPPLDRFSELAERLDIPIVSKLVALQLALTMLTVNMCTDAMEEIYGGHCVAQSLPTATATA
jgi:hypothetical protein